MKKLILVSAVLSVAAASPALAQGRSGDAHGAGIGGGMGGGVGSGPRGAPPMTPPGRSDMTASEAARGIADQRGQFGRDFAELQKLSATELKAMAAERRANAQALAAAARAGVNIPDSAEIQRALREDLELWRAEFKVQRDEWQAMRNQWLTERGSMDAADWALRRAEWFAARDAWIAAQKAWAQSAQAQ